MVSKKHKIIFVKSDGDLFAKVRDILIVSQGVLECEIEFFSQSDCMELFEQKKMSPPSFVICVKDNGNVPRELFLKVKDVFPETRRMLIVTSRERDEIIESLNNDEIHFCLVDPFKDSNLLGHIKFGFSELENGDTWEYTKRIVDEQTVKMYNIAKSYKGKDEKYQKIISKKQKEYKALKAELEKSQGDSNEISIDKYISLKKDLLSGDDYKKDFKNIADMISEVLKKIAEKNTIDLETGNYSKSVNRGKELEENLGDDINIVNSIIANALSCNIPVPKDSSDNWSTIKSDLGEDENEKDNGFDFSGFHSGGDDTESVIAKLDNVLEISIDDSKLNVQVAIKDDSSDLLTVENIFEYLRAMDVNYGLIDEQTLLTWLENRGSVGKLIVAKGSPSELPVDGKVTYYFNTDFIHAGKVKPDGSIDFRERGAIPFVEENTLLAEKIPAIIGKPGVDISGAQIAVPDPVDPIFISGDNTFDSEGGVKIYAKTGGQPHLDAMGIVSVAPVLNINSNVDYETGNVSFKGSIIVNGSVKEGFKVEGTNLVAEQIEGAQIDLTGDLNVSAGIIDSKIKVRGKIQTKYINNATIETFGDLFVTTEILDSKIVLSGKIGGSKARIIGAEIIAKGGVEVGQIGTVGSKPVKLRVGVDDYIIKLMRGVEKKLIKNKEATLSIRNEIDSLQKQDEECFKSVSESAHIQDRTQLEMKEYRKRIIDLQGAGNAQETQALKNEISKLEKKAVDAEKMVEDALDKQDEIAESIKIKDKEIENIEAKNIILINEAKGLKEYSEKSNALARVIVNGKIMSGTRIEAQNSSMTVRNDTTRCRIEETKPDKDGGAEYPELYLSNM